ncbi:MAG: hypothetical protein DME96_08165 [Verrucomicrobia bacterium]|nr:MAG: hypothetical protein DME96_08165 [Verrucomicrobiota bacterium]
MTTDALREAIRTGNPFKITMADGRTFEVPHPEFAMISGSGRIFYIAKPDNDLFETFDLVLITRKHPDIFVKPGSDRMPADQGPTDVLDPTSMRPAGLSPFGLVLAAELELTLAQLAP